MQLIIHRGTHEIGGSCVEIKDENTRLLFDFGLPLDDRENIKLNINGLYKNDKPEIDGIFITHSHPDHYCLLSSVNSEIHVYTSKTTANIIQNVSKIKGENNYSDLNLNIIEKPVNIGDYTIIPHEVDHSAGGSLAFEIIRSGKKILYTGDLRFHGRTSYLSRNLAKIKNVDYLIMEGSTLGRPDQKLKTEEDVFDEMTNAFTTDKLCFVNFSSQNLDRFISVYKACLKTKKSLVIDPYTCFVLENFKEISKNIPQWNWNNIRVYFGGGKHTKNLAGSGKLFTYKSKKISVEEILSYPEKYVVKTAKAICDKILSLYDVSKIEYIYSMWSGYLDNPSYLDILKPQIRHIHTSGHAYISDLQEFVQKIEPKVIIPIHTQLPEKYTELYNAEIKILKDGEILNL
jgi:ribonuclease J